jgi:curved DNA-binding protein CbpA
MAEAQPSSVTHYHTLNLHPSASAQQIRQAYRELSKLYHPDTTKLPQAIATAKFQRLNEAYATLSSPDRRALYDRQIGYSRVPVIQPLPSLRQPAVKTPRRSAAYLDPTDRPLSPGELFALFTLGLTFIGCLMVVLAIGLFQQLGLRG